MANTCNRSVRDLKLKIAILVTLCQGFSILNARIVENGKWSDADWTDLSHPNRNYEI